MLKWILIILGVIVLLVLGTCFWGYKQLTSKGSTAAVMVATTPERAWTWLSTADSIRAVSDSSATISISGSGMLEVGDTLRVGSSTPMPEGTSSQIIWVVTSVDAPRTRTYSAREDATRPGILERIDSVAVIGDSVRISTTFAMPAIVGAAGSDSIGKIGSAVLSGSAKVMMGGMSYVQQIELDRLKARLERP